MTKNKSFIDNINFRYWFLINFQGLISKKHITLKEGAF